MFSNLFSAQRSQWRWWWKRQSFRIPWPTATKFEHSKHWHLHRPSRSCRALLKAGGYEIFNSTTTHLTRQKMQARWQDAVKRSFELAKFDPRYKQEERCGRAFCRARQLALCFAVFDPSTVKAHARAKQLLFVCLNLQQEKPKVLKKPRFSKVSAIKPEQKGLNLQLKVFKLLAFKGIFFFFELPFI